MSYGLGFLSLDSAITTGNPIRIKSMASEGGTSVCNSLCMSLSARTKFSRHLSSDRCVTDARLIITTVFPWPPVRQIEV